MYDLTYDKTVIILGCSRKKARYYKSGAYVPRAVRGRTGQTTEEGTKKAEKEKEEK